MATTTNYSWSTPDDTALVKDGAAAIRSLGTAIDTTTYNNSLLPIVKTIVDAKGDIIAATAADTVSRLAVGANDTVLTADSTAATGLKWAAAGAGANWSLLNSGGTALTGATTITVSGISNKDKVMIMFTGASSVNAEAYFGVRLNGDTGNNYNSLGLQTVYDGSSSIGLEGINRLNDAYVLMCRIAGDGQSAASVGEGFLQINGCTTAGLKVFNGTGAGNNGTGRRSFTSGGFYNSASTISSISLFSLSGNFDAGTMYVYTSA